MKAFIWQLLNLCGVYQQPVCKATNVQPNSIVRIMGEFVQKPVSLELIHQRAKYMHLPRPSAKDLRAHGAKSILVDGKRVWTW